MNISDPQYPIQVRFADGDRWSLDNEIEVAKSIEWFDSEDPEEEAEVSDALGRRVTVKIEAHRVIRLALTTFGSPTPKARCRGRSVGERLGGKH